MNYKSWYAKKYTPEQIKEIQKFLEVDADGIVGDKTINAVKDYQDAYGLTADGLWGKDTQAKADEWNKKWDEFTPTGKYSQVDENEELYKEYAKNLDKKYEQEEREKYESNFAPNVEMSNVELAYLNKEIDKVKNQLAQRQSDYESVPMPKTQVGWASYIANNDSSLLNKYQDAERAWYNKMKDHEHAKELANAQMEQQAAYRMDDNMKNRSLALNKLQYAKAALENDTSNDRMVRAGLVRDVRNAQEELNYWNKAVGIEEEANPKEITPKEESKGQESNPKEITPTTKVKTKDYSAIEKFKNQAEKDKILKEIESNPAFNNDDALREVYNTLKGIVPEDKKASDKEARRAKWEAGKQLTGFDYRKWKESPEGKALIKEFGE